MSRELFTRREWLAVVAGGVTAGCGGRAAERDSETATATATTRPTATAPPTTTAAASGATDGVEESMSVDADSFEQGPGDCALAADPVPEGTWPMSHRDPAGTNAAPAANGPTGFPLNERWTMSALEAQVTMPVADDKYVYLVAADPEPQPGVPVAAVLCHDPRRNGEIQWRHRVDAMPVGPPVAAAGMVYVPFGPAENARVLAIDRSEGTLRNSYTLPGRFVGELGTAGTSLVMPSEDAYRVVDARSGEFCWSFAPNDVTGTDRQDRKIRAAAVGDGVAYVGTGYPDSQPTTEVGHVYAVDPDISGMRWHVPLDGPVGRVAVADDTVTLTTGNGVVGLDPASGEQRWRASSDTSIRPDTLAVSNGLAVYGTRRQLYGRDVATGEQQWSLGFGVRGDVIFVENTLFAVGRADPTSKRILLAAVDARSGDVRWTQEIYDPLVDVMAANGYLYAITSDGRLFAFTSV
ncbi:Outer membrane protein assembly factor BamB, contains PQQ-like beta-propeller repeat [Haloplanus vescus]|uniref:Outer membrane protein assembly factor BamB, contains PQQ-like beta-propeller repeat n=1 Tax=Haloplanus vescus TaxID=555874 RepID=A0A1H3Z6Z0_9EURY|nr:PQQ-binding-like beta-propeller repeat protein [Haloplanus vescus]SEA19445.1 Outer membrane protein assembly factor BamB, contains PQQ-like beta-propeller repeat [Haloplanus vescus]